MNPRFEHNLETAITRSLERQPQPAIPPDFAARVAASLPPLAQTGRRAPVARLAAIIAAVILTIAVIGLAPHATPSFASLTFDMELLLLAQLTAIAWWFSTPHNT